MEKLSNLLDETTIISFRLLWKLIERYRSHLPFVGVLFISLFGYFYFSQPLIYSVSVPVKTVAKHTVSNDLSALLPVENTSSLNLSELSVALSSFGFIKSYAEEVINDSQFENLDFGAITNGRSITGSSVKKNCKNDKKCMIDLLANALSGTFSIEQGMTEDRYQVTVSALNEVTVINLARILVKSIDKSRIETRRYLVVKEMESVENLIKESRSMMSKMDGFNLLEENERNQLVISDLKEKLRSLQSSINGETSSISALEARVLENKKTLEKVAKVDKLERLQGVTLRKKIEDIRQNIASLSSVPEAMRSNSDKKILDDLNIELKKLEEKLAQTTEGENVNLFTDDFGKQQEVHENTFEFEYYVAKNKLTRLEQEYAATKAKLDFINKDKISNDNTVNKLKTDLDFLKNLEAKQMSLKLMSSTMTSDLVFEEISSKAREFRRSSVLKIFLYCFFNSFFLYVVSILFRYFTDDKIYSEDDLKMYFKNLDFIGEVPSFD